MLDALDISSAVVNNTVLAHAITEAKEAIREGWILPDPSKPVDTFPLVSHMISIGEKSGQLEEMLLRVADAYDNEVHTTVEGLTSLVEPVIIVE